MASLRKAVLLAGACAVAACQSPAERARVATTPASPPVPAATPPASTQPDTTLPTLGAPTPEAASSPAVLARTRLRILYKSDLERGLIPAASRQFILTTHDLNADGQPEIVVGLTGSYFCGSGGCTWLLLTPTGALLTNFSVSRYPVVVSDTRTKGWNDLLVESRSAYHRLQFNGKTYPANPSVQPLARQAPRAALPRLLAESTATLTF